jgi:hypothetical protein
MRQGVFWKITWGRRRRGAQALNFHSLRYINQDPGLVKLIGPIGRLILFMWSCGTRVGCALKTTTTRSPRSPLAKQRPPLSTACSRHLLRAAVLVAGPRDGGLALSTEPPFLIRTTRRGRRRGCMAMTFAVHAASKPSFLPEKRNMRSESWPPSFAKFAQSVFVLNDSVFVSTVIRVRGPLRVTGHTVDLFRPNLGSGLLVRAGVWGAPPPLTPTAPPTPTPTPMVLPLPRCQAGRLFFAGGRATAW